MDNSPRGRRNAEAGRHMGWIDLSSQVALMCLCIARLAEMLGNAAMAATNRLRWEYYGKFVQRYCWSPRSQFFHDYLEKDNWLSTKTAAGFWPMLAEFATAAQVQALAEHLENPQTFGRPCPVPTLSYDDPNYVDSGEYWLGGVWAPTNYMVVTGLRRNGRHDLARRLAMKYLDHMTAVYRDYGPRPGTIWECYSPEQAVPAAPEHSTGAAAVGHDFAGWTALGPTAMFYEAILGLDVDGFNKTVTWQIGLLEEHGIEDLPVGDARLNLRFARRDSADSPARIEAKATKAMKLVIVRGGKSQTVNLEPGKVQSVNV